MTSDSYKKFTSESKYWKSELFHMIQNCQSFLKSNSLQTGELEVEFQPKSVYF